ncbi:MAG: hypothetical protein R2867_18190 [Caldilineaceae bacterium]
MADLGNQLVLSDAGHWYEELGWIQATLPHRDLFSLELRLALLIVFYSIASHWKGLKPLIAIQANCSN